MPAPDEEKAVASGADTGPAANPYSSFTELQKWFIVTLGAIGAICSPISSNIYAPAIPTLAAAFRVSTEKINLTVTVYMIFQAITPAFWAAAADSWGRRPVYIGTLSLFTLGCLGSALCPTSAYWLLMLMRIVQSSGASATIAVGAGLTGDIAAPGERGKYIGIFNTTSTLGPTLGPLLGGVLAGALSWRAIFWALVILGGAVLVPVVLFLPETLRSLVGDGSQPPPSMNMTLRQCLRGKRHRKGKVVELMDIQDKGEESREEAPAPLARVKYAPFTAFRLLLAPDMLLVLLWASVYYALYYAVLIIFSTLLETQYHYSAAIIGACYLPSGAGVALGGFITGKLMDKAYAREVARVGGDHRSQPRFRLERVRLSILVPHVVLMLASSLALGWSMRYRAHISIPLIAVFVFGIGTGFLTTVTVFALDLFPRASSAAAASFNLTRCLCGAAMVAAVQPLNRALGAGWLFVVCVGICLTVTPLPLIVLRYGPDWRARRKARPAT